MDQSAFDQIANDAKTAWDAGDLQEAASQCAKARELAVPEGQWVEQNGDGTLSAV